MYAVEVLWMKTINRMSPALRCIWCLVLIKYVSRTYKYNVRGIWPVIISVEVNEHRGCFKCLT
jgi:hypothetical protein